MYLTCKWLRNVSSIFLVHMVSACLFVLVTRVSDLVPREAVEKWLKYLREELPAVAFKCSTQEQRSNLGWKSSSKAAKSSSKAAKPSNLLQTSDCLGADTLIKLLKNYSRSHEVSLSLVFCNDHIFHLQWLLWSFIRFSVGYAVCSWGFSCQYSL